MNRILIDALTKIAQFNDLDANRYLIETGSYTKFYEPGAVATAREALDKLYQSGPTPPHQEEAFNAIAAERMYQDTRWPSMQHARIGEEVLLLDKLVTEARDLWAAEKYPELGALNMMRKIAAVAVRCMENHGVLPRKFT